MAEQTRNPANDSTFMDVDKMLGTRLRFVVSLRCTLGEDLYKLVNATEPTPFSINFQLCNVGKSSFEKRCTLLDASGRKLGQTSKQMVLVDEVSRKPVPIPEWWKRKHGSQGVLREKKEVFQYALHVPAENTYQYSMKPSWNDVDSYHHVNYVSYVMFCFDAAMDAIKHGFYIGFFDDILKYNVKTLQIRFMGEALAGDNLTVVTWQDAQNLRIIHFSIEREGNALVQCSIEFFLRAKL